MGVIVTFHRSILLYFVLIYSASLPCHSPALLSSSKVFLLISLTYMLHEKGKQNAKLKFIPSSYSGIMGLDQRGMEVIRAM